MTNQESRQRVFDDWQRANNIRLILIIAAIVIMALTA